MISFVCMLVAYSDWLLFVCLWGWDCVIMLLCWGELVWFVLLLDVGLFS